MVTYVPWPTTMISAKRSKYYETFLCAFHHSIWNGEASGYIVFEMVKLLVIFIKIKIFARINNVYKKVYIIFNLAFFTRNMI